MGLAIGLAKIYGRKWRYPNEGNDISYIPLARTKTPTLSDVIKHSREFIKRINKELKNSK